MSRGEVSMVPDGNIQYKIAGPRLWRLALSAVAVTLEFQLRCEFFFFRRTRGGWGRERGLNTVLLLQEIFGGEGSSRFLLRFWKLRFALMSAGGGRGVGEDFFLEVGSDVIRFKRNPLLVRAGTGCDAPTRRIRTRNCEGVCFLLEGSSPSPIPAAPWY